MPAFFHLFSRRVLFSDGVIDLSASSRDETDEKCGIVNCYAFDIHPSGSRRYAGYVSIRIGESPELYYLGHVGYRVEEGYRGDHFALRACILLEPLLYGMHIRSLVITNDPDNLASRRTCEKLGCILEGTVPVPEEYRFIVSGSTAKCRYLWLPDRNKSRKDPFK